MSRFVLFISVISTLGIIATLLLQVPSSPSLPTTQPYTKSITKIASPVAFKDTSINWNITATHTQSSKHLTALTETLGSGVCSFDFNQDGWMDLFFVGGSGHSRHYGRKTWWSETNGNRLLLNTQGKSFEDITEKAGLNQRIWGMACATADFNNDGLHDLLVTGIESNTLYQNKGDGTFEDVTTKSGIDNKRWSTGASLGDFNQDGLLDIYISNYIRYKKGARTFERTSGFRTTGSVAFDPTLYDPEPNQLFINKGNFVFEEITKQTGVANSLGRSLGAHWVDLNNDSWLDLIVINDHNSPNQVFINQQGREFSRGEEHYAAFEVAGAHDIIKADYDNNGQDDFFMSRGMSHPPVLLSKMQPPPTSKLETDKAAYTDLAWSRNLAQAKLLPFTAWGSTSGDFNNDGFLDIYVANGMTMPDIDTHFVTQAQENSLFINQSGGHFKHVEASLNPSGLSTQHPYSSRGTIAVDLNNDGKLEILVSNNNDPLQIFENQSANDNTWIGFDLLSTNKAADVYGATLELTTELMTIKRTLGTNQNFLSQGDPRIHLGLGDSQQVKKLLIKWPNKQSSSFENLKPNQYYRIRKSDHSAQAIRVDKLSKAKKELVLSRLSETSLTSYSQALLQASPKEVWEDILTAWNLSSDLFRLTMLKQIKQKWNLHYLAIVRQALQSEGNKIRLLAIEILKQAELESSIVWLLPLLHDSNQQVQCAVAETFEHFFNEEEAVTHRKKLAISPLIKLLESGSPPTQICAANALAAAENKRAIVPLLNSATKAKGIKVRNASIRALGLIRDTSVNKKLISLVQNPDSDATTTASALIALKRLDEPTLKKLLDTRFNSSDTNVFNASSASLTKSYQVLASLFTQPDGIVFSRKKLDEFLSQVISETSLLPRISHDKEADLIISKLRAITAAKLNNRLDTVKIELNHPNSRVRFHALHALSVINSTLAKNLLAQQLLSEPISTLSKLVNASDDVQSIFSDHFVSQLANRANESAEYLNNLIALLSRLPKNTANKLFNTLLDQKLTNTQTEVLLQFCAANGSRLSLTEKLTANEIRSQYPSTTLRYTYLNCYFNDHSSQTSKLLQLRKRLVLKSFLADKEWDAQHVTHLLLTAAAIDPVTANTILLQSVISKNTLLVTSSKKIKALKLLVKQGVTPELGDILWSIVKNTHVDQAERLQAASLLMQSNEANVLSYINKQLLNYD